MLLSILAFLLAFLIFFPSLFALLVFMVTGHVVQLWLGQDRNGHPSPPPGQVRILPNPFLSHCLCFETSKQTLQ